MIASTGINSPAVKQADNEQDIKYETREDHSTLKRDDFMKLFVKQLQYQDPLNPMKSAEMASQVAQFNMVDLMYKNNTAMEGMASALNTSASVSAVSLLGHGVEYQGSELYIGDDGPRPFYIQAPDTGIASGSLTIKDAGGRVVKSIDLGAAEPGTRTRLDWDGTDSAGNELPEGTYHVSIEAQDLNGNDIDIQTLTTGTVSGIDNAQDGLPRILIKDGPVIKFNEIKSVHG